MGKVGVGEGESQFKKVQLDKENVVREEKGRLVKKYRQSLNRFPLEVFSSKRAK